MSEEFIMTQKGYDEAVEKLKYLQTEKRKEITERIKVARGFGDLSENAEYDAARNEQAMNRRGDPGTGGQDQKREDRRRRVRIFPRSISEAK